MSVLKAYRIENKAMIETNYEEIKEQFKNIMETFYFTSSTDENKLKAVQLLISYYTIYGIKYLMNISDNLSEVTHNRDTMSFMNSLLVEMLYDVGHKYYIKDMSYSIVDKSIQRGLDLLLEHPEYTMSRLVTEIKLIVVEELATIKDSYVEEEVVVEAELED